jgi:hypothetical protein
MNEAVRAVKFLAYWIDNGQQLHSSNQRQTNSKRALEEAFSNIQEVDAVIMLVTISYLAAQHLTRIENEIRYQTAHYGW